MSEDDAYNDPIEKPMRLLGLKPERGYIMWLPTGEVAYEMKLEDHHMEMAIKKQMLIIDSTEMTFFDAKYGEWFKLMRLSETIKHGKRITENDSESKNTGDLASNARDKRPKKERKT